MDIERDLTTTTVSFDLKSSLPNQQKSSVKSSVKTADKIKGLMKTEPEISLSQIAETLGLSTRAIEKSVRKMQLNGEVERKDRKSQERQTFSSIH